MANNDEQNHDDRSHLMPAYLIAMKKVQIATGRVQPNAPQSLSERPPIPLPIGLGLKPKRPDATTASYKAAKRPRGDVPEISSVMSACDKSTRVDFQSRQNADLLALRSSTGKTFVFEYKWLRMN